MIRIAFASAALAALAACASTTADGELEPAVAPDPAPVVSEPAATSPFDLAMDTVATLSAQGNEQAAIDRLTQLLGNPDLTDEEKASALYARAQLRYGEGNDVYGAISDIGEMLALMPDHPDAVAASEMRDIARGEATSLNFLLEQGNQSRTERFETLFRLGEHQEAMDLMLDAGLTPSNDYLIDLYQMGYLCEGEEYGGPIFNGVEPDGTRRALQYCDFGK